MIAQQVCLFSHRRNLACGVKLALAGGQGAHSAQGLSNTLKRLSSRWFLMRDAHASEGTVLVQPRWAMSFMRGPMTRGEIRDALARRDGGVHVSSEKVTIYQSLRNRPSA